MHRGGFGQAAAIAVISAAVIGLGVGECHIAGFEADRRCRVSALCDVDEERLADVGKRYPGRRMTTAANEILADPAIDVVSIASFDDDHYAQVMAALSHGKHVFVAVSYTHLDVYKRQGHYYCRGGGRQIRNRPLRRHAGRQLDRGSARRI